MTARIPPWVSPPPRRQITPAAWLTVVAVLVIFAALCSCDLPRESQRSGRAHNPTAPGAAPGPATNLLSSLDALHVRLITGRLIVARWSAARHVEEVARLHDRRTR